MTKDNIRRLISNQKAEHMPHAFGRSGGAGMLDFRLLYPVLRALPGEELRGWMRMIDAMRETHGDCQSCTGKILAYSILFTDEILPPEHAQYVRLYLRNMACRRTDRDYMEEVLDGLNGAGPPASERLDPVYWRRVFDEPAPQKS